MYLDERTIIFQAALFASYFTQAVCLPTELGKKIFQYTCLQRFFIGIQKILLINF